MGILKSLKEKLKSKPSLEVQQEVIRGLVTSGIYKILEEQNISKAELAQKLGISKAAVTRYLSGERNFTIDTLTHIAYVFDKAPKVSFVPLDSRFEAPIYDLSAQSCNEVDVQNELRTSSSTIKIASNGW